jgi:putative DNA primase/helicase
MPRTEDKRLQQAMAAADKALQASAPPEAPRFELRDASELRSIPRPRWAIKRLLPREGVAFVYGAPGSGKSFVVQAMAAALAGSTPFFGHSVPAALRVAMVALEGHAGISARVQAYEAEYGKAYPAGVLFLVGQPFNLLDDDDRVSLAKALHDRGGADVLIIDTLNQATLGIDENSPDGAGRILQATRHLQDMTGALIVFVHHTGKDHSKGLRGHSSFDGAADCKLKVARELSGRQLTVEKLKDDEDGKSFSFDLRVHEVGVDDDGDPITSCAIVPADDDGLPRQRIVLPKGGNQRIVFDALGEEIVKAGRLGKGGAPSDRPCVTLSQAIALTRGKLLEVEPKRQSERAKEALKGLVASRALQSSTDADGEVWLWFS